MTPPRPHPPESPPDIPRCAHPACFDRGMERTRFTRTQVDSFTPTQLSRVLPFPCPTFPGLFHTRTRPGWHV